MKAGEGTAAREFERLAQIMKRLRSPGGCPWDAEQTPESLKPYLLEEACEVLDAIGGDPAHLCEELGDLMLQIVFLSRIFQERGCFDVADVCRGIADKLERRHPHVFGDQPAGDSDDLEKSWNRIKADEKVQKGQELTLLGGIPRQLPGLAQSQKMVRKANAASATGPDQPPLAEMVARTIRTIQEAVASPQPAAGIGVAAYLLTKIAEGCGVDAEQALRATVRSIANDLERRAAGSETLPADALAEAERSVTDKRE